MFTQFLTKLGFTRDWAGWLWLRLVSLATIVIAGGLPLLHTWTVYVGWDISDVWAHRIIAVAALVLYMSGKQASSGLPSSAEKNSVTPPIQKETGV